MLRKIKSIAKKILSKKAKVSRRLNKISITEVLSDIDKLPVNKGDSLFVHSTLSSVGFIEGDIKLIIDKLIEKVGEHGRIFMPSFSSTGYTFEYLKSKPVFDVNKTSSTMGKLTEIFRKNFQVSRSIHPTHSVLVWAKDSDQITSEHHLDVKPFGEKSPFYKFLQLPNTKVLCLGMTIFPVTVFRVYETVNLEKYPLKVFLDEEFEVDALDKNGINLKVKTLAHNPVLSNLRRNMLFENYFISKELLTKHKIGNSTSYLLNTSNFYSLMEENFKKGNLPYLGCFKDFEKHSVDKNRLFILKS